MRILFTNDDGIDSPGINILAGEFCGEHESIMVAPDSERSAFSHSLTMFKDLEVKKVEKNPNITAYSTSGTPADCVKFAVLYLLKNSPPDLVISGINTGPNLGSDIMYSGTVAAAMESAYLGIPSIAVSLNYWNKEESYYLEAARFIKRNLEELSQLLTHSQAVLNINYPTIVPYKGVKLTRAGLMLYSDLFDEQERSGFYRLKGMPIEHNKNVADCDVEWSKKGYATITPLKIDRTDFDALKLIKDTVGIK